MLVSFIFGSTSQVQPVTALPISPTDESKVPHYFGPYPNWANSPFTQPDVAVEITGDGAGATAVASVGANGAITGITITSPGSGYSTATVIITGAGTGATADASVTTSGVVTDITVNNAGSGYTQPVVTITGGGGTGATATAYGGVDAVVLGDPGIGYSFPTVDFDLPDDPNGVQARGHVLCATVDCIPANPGDPITIIGVQVDNPGSGYTTAPNVVIRDGTLFDPINPTCGIHRSATATATLSISAVTVNTYGAGYTSAPSVAIIDQTGTGSGATATAFTDVGGVTAINLTAAGSGYVTAGGIQKFTDPLPGLCVPPACPTSGKYIPLGVSEVKTYNGAVADEYVIGLVQYRTSFSSSLPPTLVRGYVQLETAANAGISQHFPLTNANLDPALPDYSNPDQREPGIRSDLTPIPGTDHRSHQGPTGAHRFLQPATNRRRW